jgi:capsular exopolysaccharide synthesis family protein
MNEHQSMNEHGGPQGRTQSDAIEQTDRVVFAEDLPAPAQNPLLMVHRFMRGRYLYAFILAALLAPVGAIAGYMAMPGKFVSSAQIRVPAALDPILYDVQEQLVGAGGYERVVGNEVEQMSRPDRMREAASLLSQYVNVYNEGLAPALPDHAPGSRDWRIDEARAAASELIRIASDEATFRAYEQDWALRAASGSDTTPTSMLEAVSPGRLLSPVGQTMPTREEIALTSPGELVIDPRTARRVVADFADLFQSTTAPRPPRGQEPPIVWDAGPGAAERLSAMVSITPPRRSELINIEAQTDDPRLAALASNAILVTHRASSAYADSGKRLRELRAREAELDQQLRLLRRDVLAIRNGYDVVPTATPASSAGSEVPFSQDPRYLDRIDPELRDTVDGYRPAGLQRVRTSVSPDELYAEGAAVLSTLNAELRSMAERIADLELATALNEGTDDEALEKADPVLRDLKTEQRTLQLQIDRVKSDFGPNHRSLRGLESQLQIVSTRVSERIAELRKQIEDVKAESESESGAAAPEALVAELEALKRRTDERRRDIALVEAWLDVIPDAILDLIDRESEAARTARLLDEVRREREQLEVEMVNLVEGRFQYFSAQVPQNPSSDKRIPLAAAGFAGAGGFAFLLVAGIGFLDRRYRYIEDVESNHKLPPVIGVLPMLTEKSRDAEQSEVASLTVHHIRNMLLLDGRPQPGRARAITITSAGPGDGKTSVVVALGMSFAQAGYRTLVIDADLVGRGLSAHFDARNTEGLSEALTSDPGEPIAVRPVQTDSPGLSILSAGSTDDFRPEHMARERFAEVINHFRRAYDVVLIDSGPLLGSLEAGLATRSADRIVLVVARGSEQRSVSAVVKRLRDGGLRHVSLVFNKARPEDIEQSVSYISMRSQSIRAADQAGPNRRTVALARTLQPSASSKPETEEAAT